MGTITSRSKRLDQAMIDLYPQITRSLAARLIKDGKVQINHKVNCKPGYKLQPNDQIVLDDQALLKPQPAEIDLEILYEDDDCLVINKPTGILSHSKGAFNSEATVATWLKDKLNGEFISDRAGIVHRLDRPTSGVMILAKNENAARWIQKQFSSRKVKKSYLAIVDGQMPYQKALIDMPIMRNPRRPQTFKVGNSGKPATTEYIVKKYNGRFSLLELHPQTGRTHQLRVHLKALKQPIVGDTFYGGQVAARLYLHAWQLELTLPNRTRKKFTVPMPKTFETMMKT